MPVYEYHCDKCKRDVRVTLSISAHNKAKVACPRCGNKGLRPLVSTFFAQTSRKSSLTRPQKTPTQAHPFATIGGRCRLPEDDALPRGSPSARAARGGCRQ